MKNIKVVCDKVSLIEGLGLICIGIILPLFCTEKMFSILDTNVLALREGEASILLVGATKLVIMNTIRAVPHYLGAFIISDSFFIYMNKKRVFLINIFFTVMLVLGVYHIIFICYGIKYDFGMPALIVSVFISFLARMNLFSVALRSKILIVTTLLLSVQWLDVVTTLSPHRFGRGNISMEIKMFSNVLECSRTLDYYSVSMCVAFLCCTLFEIYLVFQSHKLQVIERKNNEIEKQLYDAKVEALQMKSYRENQSLVHDLKTPLTTVQGLSTLAEMMETDTMIKAYLTKISEAVATMERMISEILYKDKMSNVTMEELFHVVLSHIFITVPEKMIIYRNNVEQKKVYGNRIRLARAITNTLENAYHAVDPESGEIRILVSGKEGRICIEIEDNGCGIAKEKLASVWNVGYSENHSTGLGLAFVKEVIEDHHGNIIMESEEKKGTRIKIYLDEVV